VLLERTVHKENPIRTLIARRYNPRQGKEKRKQDKQNQANPTHEQTLTSKPLAKDQLSLTTHTYFERNTAALCREGAIFSTVDQTRAIAGSDANAMIAKSHFVGSALT
jgi:hypothetical protein